MRELLESLAVGVPRVTPPEIPARPLNMRECVALLGIGRREIRSLIDRGRIEIVPVRGVHALKIDGRRLRERLERQAAGRRKVTEGAAPVDEATIDLVARVVAQLASAVSGPTPEAMDATTTAKFLGVSRGKVYQLNSGGLMPAPVELGDRCPRWIRSELIAWLRAGAPSRPRWLLIRDQAWRRAG